MNIRQEMRTRPTYQSYPDEFNPALQINITENKSDEPIAPSGFGMLYEYRVEFLYSVMFRCNDAQYESARKRAEDQLVYRLYGDIIGNCKTALNAITSGDRRTAIKEVTKILDICTE